MANRLSPADVLRLNRQQARALAERVGTAPIRALLTDAHNDLRKRIDAATRGFDPATPTGLREMRVTLAQVEDVTRSLAKDLGTTTARAAKQVAEVSVSGMTRYLSDAQRAYGSKARPLALREGAMLRRAVQGAESTVLRRLATTEKAREAEQEEGGEAPDTAPRISLDRETSVLSRYSVATIGEFETQLSTAVAVGKPWLATREALIQQSPFLQGAPVSWAERIARTETMGAYNRAGWEGIRAADDDLGDMVKILCASFDARTGWDSYQVHGQIRLPDEAFEWAGGLYQHPPNRPNDREVVVPHRKSWSIPPELAWRGDGEVMAAWLRDRRKGAPPARPDMTTVPLDQFGKG